MPTPHAEIWAVVALLPLLFYVNAFARGKAAPKLRSAYTPYILFALQFLAVYFSGGLNSPLFGVFALLTLCVTLFATIIPALVISAAITLLWFLLKDDASIAPLALPWAGLVLGRFVGLFKPSLVIAPSETPRSSPAPIASSSSVKALPEVDTEAWADKNAATVLDLAHHAHPNWNSIILLWIDAGTFRCRQARTRLGTLKPDFLVSEGDGLLGLSLRDKKRVCIGDLAPSTASALPYYEGEIMAKALMISPFFDEGELRGALLIDRSEPGEWSTDEIAAVDFLGRQIVQQSQLAGYVGREQARGRQVSELYEISKQLADDLDSDGLVAKFPGLLGRLLRFDSYYLSMREDEGEFAVVASRGYEAGFQSSYKLDEDTVLGGWVLTSGEPLTYNASHAEASVPRFLTEGLSAEAGSFLLLPLMRHGRVSGLLKLDRGGSDAFTEADKEVALIFTKQVAVTLDNARLYTQHKRQATTDGLTGLYNHRYFQERLAHEIEVAKRTNKPLSLALTDIDFFKKFNDTFGHQEGDNVLKKCSKMLQENVRQGKDVVCRYGGEEFVIIMPDCDLVEARQVVEHVRQTCAEKLIGGTGPEARSINLSIGLCSYPLGAKEQRDIIHKADEALYKAKQTGRNRTCSFKDLP